MRTNRRNLNQNNQIKDVTNAHIQPPQEIPSLYNAGQENADRINAHDLFSYYTADIIKEDTIFAR